MLSLDPNGLFGLKEKNKFISLSGSGETFRVKHSFRCLKFVAQIMLNMLTGFFIRLPL